MIRQGLLCMLCLVGMAFGQESVSANVAALSKNALALSTNALAFSTNTLALSKNALALSAKALAFSANTLAFSTNTLAFPSNALAFSTNTLAFSSNALAFSTNTLALPTNVVELTAAELAPATNETIITSDRMEYDYPRTLAIFTGNVLVRGTDMKMWADEMTVIMTPEDEMESVTAIGRVRIFQPGRKARCRKAIFLVDRDEVILTGDAVIEQGNDRVEGRVIHIWTDSDRMESEPGHLVMFGKDQKAEAGGRGSKVKDGSRKSEADKQKSGTLTSDL